MVGMGAVIERILGWGFTKVNFGQAQPLSPAAEAPEQFPARGYVGMSARPVPLRRWWCLELLASLDNRPTTKKTGAVGSGFSFELVVLQSRARAIMTSSLPFDWLLAACSSFLRFFFCLEA